MPHPNNPYQLTQMTLGSFTEDIIRLYWHRVVLSAHLKKLEQFSDQAQRQAYLDNKDRSLANWFSQTKEGSLQGLQIELSKENNQTPEETYRFCLREYRDLQSKLHYLESSYKSTTAECFIRVAQCNLFYQLGVSLANEVLNPRLNALFANPYFIKLYSLYKHFFPQPEPVVRFITWFYSEKLTSSQTQRVQQFCGWALLILSVPLLYQFRFAALYRNYILQPIITLIVWLISLSALYIEKFNQKILSPVFRWLFQHTPPYWHLALSMLKNISHFDELGWLAKKEMLTHFIGIVLGALPDIQQLVLLNFIWIITVSTGLRALLWQGVQQDLQGHSHFDQVTQGLKWGWRLVILNMIWTVYVDFTIVEAVGCFMLLCSTPLVENGIARRCQSTIQPYYIQSMNLVCGIVSNYCLQELIFIAAGLQFFFSLLLAPLSTDHRDTDLPSPSTTNNYDFFKYPGKPFYFLEKDTEASYSSTTTP